MASSLRVVAALLSGVCLGACALPAPDYKVMQWPAPFRKDADGAALDNADMRLDAEGYRVDKRGNQVETVDIPAKTAGQASNAMAGFYISSTGQHAPGQVMAPSEGAAAGAGYGPGSATVTPATATPASSGTAPMTTAPGPTGQPVPLAPPK
ncbi:MAG TPA: hypothetical protein VKY24_16320 [Reyranella sp.]|nr:hypothetical protein [Reyranella sp.]